MTPILVWLLRLAGIGLIVLTVLHIPIARQLRWREDVERLTPVNASVFRVHTLFICLVLLLMAAPCLLEPMVFLERTRAGAWLGGLFAIFWTCRLFAQWFIYPADLWRGKRLETSIHLWFTLIWAALAALFASCFLVQTGLSR